MTYSSSRRTEADYEKADRQTIELLAASAKDPAEPNQKSPGEDEVLWIDEPEDSRQG